MTASRRHRIPLILLSLPPGGQEHFECYAVQGVLVLIQSRNIPHEREYLISTRSQGAIVPPVATGTRVNYELHWFSSGAGAHQENVKKT